MEERYRKLICPNGHASEAIGENNPLPRRCIICRQQYLKNAKPIWCDKYGNEIKEEVPVINEPNGELIPKKTEVQEEVMHDFASMQGLSGRRRRRTSFLDEPQDEEVVQQDGVIPVTAVAVERPARNTFCLVSGDYSIELTGEGVLGREHLGKEILGVNQLVSRKHCYFIATMQRGLQIRDAGSLNGTYIDTGNGRVAVSKETSVILKSGDKLWLADMLFEVKEVGEYGTKQMERII